MLFLRRYREQALPLSWSTPSKEPSRSRKSYHDASADLSVDDIATFADPAHSDTALVLGSDGASAGPVATLDVGATPSDPTPALGGCASTTDPAPVLGVGSDLAAPLECGACTTSNRCRCNCFVTLFACSRSCLLYTSPSPRDKRQSRMPSSA